MKLEDPIRIGGSCYTARFRGFDNELYFSIAATDSDRVYSFAPWRLASHLKSLSDCLTYKAGTPVLEEKKLAAAVLEANNIEVTRENQDFFLPIALWWAAGGTEEVQMVPAENSWFQIGTARIKARRWNFLERDMIFKRCLTDKAAPDIAAVFREMIHCSVTEVEPHEVRPENFDSFQTRILLEYLTGLHWGENSGSSLTKQILEHGTAEGYEKTLELCRVLGWTPGQILLTPADEIDALYALVSKTKNSKKTDTSSTYSSKLASYPDSVVIQIDD